MRDAEILVLELDDEVETRNKVSARSWCHDYVAGN